MLLFPCDSKAAVQTCWLLTKNLGGKANLRHLLALSYLVDRQCLIETGAPLIGGTIVSGDYGPACLEMLRCDTKLWKESFLFEGNFSLVISNDPGNGELSDYTEEVIAGVWAHYKRLEFDKLVPIMRGLPEWVDPCPNPKAGFYPTNIPIPYENILLLCGWDRQDIEAVRFRQEAINFMNNLSKR